MGDQATDVIAAGFIDELELVGVGGVRGQAVRSLVQQHQNRGEFNVLWNGQNDSGEVVASGVYFYRLSISDSDGSHSVQKKMILLR